MEQLAMSSGPHIHSSDSSRRIMLDVILALLPAAVAGVVIFGVNALWTILVCVAAAVLSEFLFNLIVKKPQTVGDLSAVVTGLLLALNLSTNVPLWQAALGSVFAIVLVKGLFGGLGRNFANPAITGRIFLLLAFTSTVAGGVLPDGTTGRRHRRDLHSGPAAGLWVSPDPQGHQLADPRDLHGHGLRAEPGLRRLQL